MAQFTGIKCDSCGQVISTEDRTRKTTRYEGAHLSGDFIQDLCPACLPEPGSITLKPLRRRKKGDDEAEEPGVFEPPAAVAG